MANSAPAISEAACKAFYAANGDIAGPGVLAFLKIPSFNGGYVDSNFCLPTIILHHRYGIIIPS